MSPMAIGWIVFALVFGSALVGMSLHRVLPAEHVSSDSKDVVKLGGRAGWGDVGTGPEPARRLGKSAFDTRSSQLVQVSADMVLVDRALARYGPETKDEQDLLKRGGRHT